MPEASDASPLAWWDSLKHGGMLIAPARVAAAFDEAPGSLSYKHSDRLRREIVRAEAKSSDLSDLLDVVLEQVCGFTVGWFKGSKVGSEWSTRTPAGENIKPRRVWQHEGGVLPVFVDDEPRLGVGRGRRSVARVIEWLRARSLHLALLTNGRQWRLIYAGTDHDAHCEWDTQLWFAEGEPGLQVEALRRLIAPAVWKAPPPTEGETKHCRLLQAILDSRKGQNELSAVLGERVRQAVELLIRSHGPALDRLSTQTEGDLPPVDGRDIYAAAVRTVMRMVVLMFAESRLLMPLDRSPLYFNSYSLTGLRESLESAHARGPALLHQRRSAWPRVLALFALVRDGCAHPDLMVPKYGGDLFTTGQSDPNSGMSRALAVFESACFQSDFASVMSDADVRAILEKLSYSEMTIRQGRGRIRTRVPVDFSDLQSEYIGILYEGLLDFELRRAGPDEPIVFLAIGDEPALPLSRLEAMDNTAIKNLVEKFKVKGEPKDSEEEDDAENEEDAEPEDDADTTDTDDDADADASEDDDSADTEDSASVPQDSVQQARERAWAWARRAVSVGGLVRKPRSKKAEALAQYERQVEAASRKLVRTAILPGQWYLVRWGGTRKGSGTFYTRPQLSVPTVHRTLRPLAYTPPADDPDAPTAAWTPKKPEDILALKVCDPAVGSGSFPVAALRFLTDALYRALEHHGRLRDDGNKTVIALAEGRESTGRLDEDLLPCRPTDPDFEPRLKARLRRYVVERCLYGVDLDPLAIELAKISLWIETMDRELPFSFLDHKFKCGNALVGCWFDRFRHYPIMAWLREGGDKNHTTAVHFKKDARTKAIKTHLKDVIKPDLIAMLDRMRGQDALFEAEGKSAQRVHDEALAILEQMHHLPPGEEGEHRRAELFRQLRESPTYVALKRAFDLWCALWFWPADDLVTAPKPSEFATPRPESIEAAERIAAERRFFHWELEFPDVFAAKNNDNNVHTGFSAIIGNPPWDISKPNSKEFFSSIDPLYRAYGKQEALAKQKSYFQASEHDEDRWLDYSGYFKSMSNWVNAAGGPFGDRVTEDSNGRQKHDFPLGDRGRNSFESSKARHAAWAKRRAANDGSLGYADPEHPFIHQGSADINLYKCFVEQAHALLAVDGRLGFIVPSGLYTDHGTTALRTLLLSKCRWEWLFGFENRDGIFDIHRSFKFNPIIVVKGGRTDAIRTAFMQRDPDDWAIGTAEALAVPYAGAQVERFSPRSKAILEIRSARDLAVLEKIYANSVLLGDQGPDGWGITYAREFDMTNDSALFPPRPKWEDRGYRPDEYGRWIKGDWKQRSVGEANSRSDIEAGIILSKDGNDWIAESGIETEVVEVKDAEGETEEIVVPCIGVPLYQGVMIWQLSAATSDYVSGANHSARWEPRSTFAPDLPIPQFLANPAVCKRAVPLSAEFRIGFRAIQNATNQRTFISSLLPPCPAGNSLGVLNMAPGVCGEFLVASATSFATDAALRPRMSQANLNWFVIAEVPSIGLSHCSASVMKAITGIVRSLNCAGISFAPKWLLWATDQSTSWRSRWAVTAHERLRLRCILDASVAALYGLDLDDLKWILKDCDHPVAEVTNKTFARKLDPKGFWRVDKAEPPERRHTVLTLAAFADLQALIAAGVERDDTIAAFCGQPRPGQPPLPQVESLIGSIEQDGWMLPDHFRLADLGLGHDDRAQHPQPVAPALGPRFYDWQLAQDPAESWRECELHARNLLGPEGFERLKAELEGRAIDPANAEGARSIQGEAKHTGRDKLQGGLFD